MTCDCESNHRSGNTLAMRHRLKWFINLWAQGPNKGDEHRSTLLTGYRNNQELTSFSRPLSWPRGCTGRNTVAIQSWMPWLERIRVCLKMTKNLVTRVLVFDILLICKLCNVNIDKNAHSFIGSAMLLINNILNWQNCSPGAIVYVLYIRIYCVLTRITTCLAQNFSYVTAYYAIVLIYRWAFACWNTDALVV